MPLRRPEQIEYGMIRVVRRLELVTMGCSGAEGSIMLPSSRAPNQPARRSFALLAESFADHDWLVLSPGESSLSTRWDKDGTLSLSIELLWEEHPSPWLLPEARQSRLLLSYPAEPPLIVTCPEADQAASCQMYTFKRTQIDKGRGSYHSEYQLIKAPRPNAFFIGQDWMILTCHTGLNIYGDWSSDCTSSVAEFHGDPELAVVDMHHGKSHRIIKGSGIYAGPPLFLVPGPGPGQTLPENLTWVNDSPVQYFKETLAITRRALPSMWRFQKTKRRAPATACMLPSRRWRSCWSLAEVSSFFRVTRK